MVAERKGRGPTAKGSQEHVKEDTMLVLVLHGQAGIWGGQRAIGQRKMGKKTRTLLPGSRAECREGSSRS